MRHLICMPQNVRHKVLAFSWTNKQTTNPNNKNSNNNNQYNNNKNNNNYIVIFFGKCIFNLRTTKESSQLFLIYTRK